MPRPTQRAHRAISALAAKHSLKVEDSKLTDRQIAVTVLYAGGRSLSRLLKDATLHFCRCGSEAEGEWIAVLPADELMKLLECESLLNTHVERTA